MQRTILLVLSCVTWATAAAAQTAKVPDATGSIAGCVIDAETRRPLAEAVVTLLGSAPSSG